MGSNSKHSNLVYLMFRLQCMIDEREFMDMSKIIEEKRRDKILLLTSQVNMLEILELFRESNLFIRFSRDQLEVQIQLLTFSFKEITNIILEYTGLKQNRLLAMIFTVLNVS